MRKKEKRGLETAPDQWFSALVHELVIVYRNSLPVMNEVITT